MVFRNVSIATVIRYRDFCHGIYHPLNAMNPLHVKCRSCFFGVPRFRMKLWKQSLLNFDGLFMFISWKTL
jgi:hypothetical protein